MTRTACNHAVNEVQLEKDKAAVKALRKHIRTGVLKRCSVLRVIRCVKPTIER